MDTKWYHPSSYGGWLGLLRLFVQNEIVYRQSRRRLILAMGFFFLLSTTLNTLSETPSQGIDLKEFPQNYQSTPGDIDFDLIKERPIWNSSNSIISTPLKIIDLDSDTVNEIVFGTNDGRIICIERNGTEIINVSISNDEVLSFQFGNIDEDIIDELAISTTRAIFCYDIETNEVLWSIKQDALYSKILLVENKTGTQMERKFDFIVQNSKQYNSTILRINGFGDILYKINIEPLVNEIGASISCNIIDLNQDNSEEILVTDFGFDAFPPVGLNIIGRHIWLFNSSNGVAISRNVFKDVTFASEPMIFLWHGHIHFIIGLDQDGEQYPYDLLIFNGSSNDIAFVDSYDKQEGRSWRYLSYIDDGDSTLVLLCSDSADLQLWNLETSSSVWTMDGVRGVRFYQNPIICDIDNDLRYEFALPAGGFSFRDALTGDREKSFDVSYLPKSDQHMVIGNFEKNGYSEIIFGYFNGGTHQYHIVSMYSPEPFLKIDTSKTVFPQTFYAGLHHKVAYILENVTAQRVPDEIVVQITNPNVGILGQFAISTSEGTISHLSREFMAGSSFESRLVDTSLYLEFSITPNWSLSDEGFNDIVIEYLHMGHDPRSWTFSDLFRVERDLMPVGEFDIQSRSRGILESPHWVGPGEELKVSDFSIVYEGTTDTNPPMDTFEVQVSLGSFSNNVSFIEGEEYVLDCIAPVSAGNFNIRIRVHQIPIHEFSRFERELPIKVDATPPSVIEHFPENHTWFSFNPVEFAILVEDTESGVNVSSVRYCWYPFSLGNPERDWKAVGAGNINISMDGYSIQVRDRLDEAMSTVEWSIVDRVGNVCSFNHSLGIDITKIEFSKFQPTDWVTEREVGCSITVSDIGGSGVNGGSIQYSMSFDDVFSFSEWVDIADRPDGPTISFDFVIMGQEGTNYIRCRGRDIAGNDLLSSRIYTIRIDTTSPVIEIESPTNAAVIDPGERWIIASVFETGAGMGEIKPILTNSNDRKIIEVEYSIEDLGNGHYEINITWNETNVYYYMFNITCTDLVGNIGTSPNIKFQMNQPPIIDSILPEQGSVFTVGSTITFKATTHDQDRDPLTIEWVLDDNVVLSSDFEFENASLTVGDYRIRITVRDDYYIIEETIVFSVIEEPEVQSSRTLYSLIILLIIAILSTLIIVRMRDKEQ